MHSSAACPLDIYFDISQKLLTISVPCELLTQKSKIILPFERCMHYWGRKSVLFCADGRLLKITIDCFCALFTLALTVVSRSSSFVFCWLRCESEQSKVILVPLRSPWTWLISTVMLLSFFSLPYSSAHLSFGKVEKGSTSLTQS